MVKDYTMLVVIGLLIGSGFFLFLWVLSNIRTVQAREKRYYKNYKRANSSRKMNFRDDRYKY